MLSSNNLVWRKDSLCCQAPLQFFFFASCWNNFCWKVRFVELSYWKYTFMAIFVINCVFLLLQPYLKTRCCGYFSSFQSPLSASSSFPHPPPKKERKERKVVQLCWRTNSFHMIQVKIRFRLLLVTCSRLIIIMFVFLKALYLEFSTWVIIQCCFPQLASENFAKFHFVCF